MITAIDHINLVVNDLETTVRFYTQLLDFKEVSRTRLEGKWIDSIVGLEGVKADVVFLALPGNGPRIEVLHYLSPAGETLPANSLPNTGGLRHLAFRVENISETAAKLRAAGVNVLGDLVAVPAGILPESKVRKSLCYFFDPEGVLLELAEYRET